MGPPPQLRRRARSARLHADPSAGRWGPCGSRFRVARSFLRGLNADPSPIGQSANGAPSPTTAARALRALARRPQRGALGALRLALSRRESWPPSRRGSLRQWGPLPNYGGARAPRRRDRRRGTASPRPAPGDDPIQEFKPDLACADAGPSPRPAPGTILFKNSNPTWPARTLGVGNGAGAIQLGAGPSRRPATGTILFETFDAAGAGGGRGVSRASARGGWSRRGGDGSGGRWACGGRSSTRRGGRRRCRSGVRGAWPSRA